MFKEVSNQLGKSNLIIHLISGTLSHDVGQKIQQILFIMEITEVIIELSENKFSNSEFNLIVI